MWGSWFNQANSNYGFFSAKLPLQKALCLYSLCILSTWRPLEVCGGGPRMETGLRVAVVAAYICVPCLSTCVGPRIVCVDTTLNVACLYFAVYVSVFLRELGCLD